MKTVGYLLLGVGIAWAAVLAYADASRSQAAVPAILLGLGFGFLTLRALESGSIRGASRKVRREHQPATFWTAAFVWIAASVGMVAGGLWLLFS